MRTQFEHELGHIRENVRLLGTQATRATSRAVNALIHLDLEEAREVKRNDRSSDRLRYEVENACLSVMATQQPVARTLRELLTATLVAVELERCADYAKGIAKAARRIIRADAGIEPYHLEEMEAYARDMLERAVDAFLTVDVLSARAVILDDASMDRLYRDLLASVMADMRAHATHVERGTWLLHAGHCLERIGDRAATIAARVIFIETGDLKDERGFKQSAAYHGAAYNYPTMREALLRAGNIPRLS